MKEFELVERIRRRAAGRDDVVLGIGDDGAVLAVPPGHELVVAVDTLNSGVHFPVDTAAADIGWKALAVNLSDLAAMGATPAWCTLALSLPQAGAAWIDGFLDGFLALADRHGVALVGGDTTRGPLSVCVTAHGLVASGRALRRGGARPGDVLWVSGTLGDAAAALAQWRAGTGADAGLRARLDRPTPRIQLGTALAGLARACIDVSDGLLADLGHMAKASAVAIEVQVDALPASDALARCFDGDARRLLQATGGDDYELVFSVAPDAHAEVLALAVATGVPLTCIGRVRAGSGVCAMTAEGEPWQPPSTGFEHFAAAPTG